MAVSDDEQVGWEPDLPATPKAETSTRRQNMIVAGVAVGAVAIAGVAWIGALSRTAANDSMSTVGEVAAIPKTAAPEPVRLGPGPEAPPPPPPAPAAPAPTEKPKPELKTTVVAQTVVLKLVKSYFPKEEVGNAMAVAEAESGQQNTVGEPNADGSRDWGLFQLNDGASGSGGSLQSALDGIGVKYKDERQAQELALKPEINVKAAAWMYRTRGGWGPWVAASKLGIVKELYSNEHGPNYGKFTPVGDPKKELPDGKLPPEKKPVAPAKPVKPSKPVKPTKPPTPAPAAPAQQQPAAPTAPQNPAPPADPTPTEDPATPAPSESATASASESASAAEGDSGS